MHVKSIAAAAVLLAGASTTLLAHHGWGSYDASKTVTVEGPIETSRFENPHALIVVRSDGKAWDIVLAPTSRMTTRGATAEFIAVGKRVKAVGYASTAVPNELRAERITVDGVTVELR